MNARVTKALYRAALAGSFVVGAACGSSRAESSFGPDGGDAMTSDERAAPTGFAPGAAGDAAPDHATFTLPASFVKTELGGYALGAPITGDGATDPGIPLQNADGSCSVIAAIVRDFKGIDEPAGHPDFESFGGGGPTLRLVANDIGADRKPVYASACESAMAGGPSGCPFGRMTTNKAAFDQWYRYAADVNKPYVLYLQLEPNAGVSTFRSNFYFPVDGAGWGNPRPGDDMKPHNFHFTTEIHTVFKYGGGETFTFIGDDDVWVFINGKLAIDLGGLHGPSSATIDLDQQAMALGLTKGQTYALELFQAERHTTGSTFRIDATLAFTNCGTIPADVPK